MTAIPTTTAPLPERLKTYADFIGLKMVKFFKIQAGHAMAERNAEAADGYAETIKALDGIAVEVRDAAAVLAAQDATLAAVREALAKVLNCERCKGSGYAYVSTKRGEEGQPATEMDWHKRVVTCPCRENGDAALATDAQEATADERPAAQRTHRQYQCDHCRGVWLVEAETHEPRGCTLTNCGGRQSPLPDDLCDDCAAPLSGPPRNPTCPHLPPSPRSAAQEAPRTCPECGSPLETWASQPFCLNGCSPNAVCPSCLQRDCHCGKLHAPTASSAPPVDVAALRALSGFWERTIQEMRDEQTICGKDGIGHAAATILGHRIDIYTRCKASLDRLLGEETQTPLTGKELRWCSLHGTGDDCWCHS